MPFMGVLLLFIYKKKKIYYSYHLITVLHFHCFAFFITLIQELIPFLDILVGLFLIYYSISMLKNIYEESWSITSMKYIILFITYGTTFVMAQMSLLFGKIFLLGVNA